MFALRLLYPDDRQSPLLSAQFERPILRRVAAEMVEAARA